MYSKAIGPRVVGGRYFCGFWRRAYEVLSIDLNVPVYGWSITVRWDDGTITTHSTWWEPGQDRVL